MAQNRPAKSIAPFYARSRCACRSGIYAKPHTMRCNALIAEPRHAFMHEIERKYALSSGWWRLDTQSDSRALSRRDVRGERRSSAIDTSVRPSPSCQ